MNHYPNLIMIYIYLPFFIFFSIIDSNGIAMAQRLGPKGGKFGGKEWDDGANHDNVAKVYIRGGHDAIQYIKVHYVKDRQIIDGSIHGTSAYGFTQTFEIDHLNNECIVSVDCYHGRNGVMQAIELKTNLKTSELIGYPKGTTKSTLGGVNGKMINGFNGTAGTFLNSLEAYLTKIPPIKSELQGGLYGGVYWDDGPFSGVRKIYVTYIDTFIRSINVDYDKDGQIVTREHGNKEGETKEFAIDYPNEFLTSVEGTYDTIPQDNLLLIRSLRFKTSKGRISPTYGFETGIDFVFTRQGNAIVGFHGRDGGAFDAIGVYYSPIITS